MNYFRSISQGCVNLQSLMVRGCPLVTETSLSKLRLRKIHIDRPVQQRLPLLNYPRLFLQI